MRELSLHVMDLAQNSIAAGASLIEIDALEATGERTLVLRIADNGKGMDAEQLARALSPFYTSRTTRRVGLGLPLFRMVCEMTGGTFDARSQPGMGTVISATFCTGHIDMLPLGDMNLTVSLLILSNPQLDFIYRRFRDAAGFVLDTRELRAELDGAVPLDHPEVSAWIRSFLQENEAALGVD